MATDQSVDTALLTLVRGLYNCNLLEIRTLLKASIKRELEVFQVKCLRRMIKIFWPNTISNEELGDRAGTCTLTETIQQVRWRCVPHASKLKPQSSPAMDTTEKEEQREAQGDREEDRREGPHEQRPITPDSPQSNNKPDGGLLLSPHVPQGTEKTEATSAFFAKATVPSASMISMESVHRTVSLWEQYTPVMIAENSQKKPETSSGEYWLPSN